MKGRTPTFAVAGLALLALIALPIHAATDADGGTATDTTLSNATPEAQPMAKKEAAGDVSGQSTCTATASCFGGASIACNGTNSCLAQDDQDCYSGVRGYVKCDGATTYCSSTWNCYTFKCTDASSGICDLKCPILGYPGGVCNQSTCCCSCGFL